MKEILILLDRDGTLVHDHNYHLGRQRNWKSLIKFRKGVISGLKLLSKIPNVHLYMITNQPGVAVTNFPLLTRKRGNEVCEDIIKRIKKKGVEIEGYSLCGYAHPSYSKKHPEFKFNKKLLKAHSCIKPKTGMVKEAIKKLKLKRPTIYVVGDRASDIQTAIKSKGTGVLVPFSNRPDEPKKTRKLKGKKYISKGFLDAAKYIAKSYRR